MSEDTSREARIQADLEAAERAVVEHEHHDRRARRAAAELVCAEERMRELSHRLADETRDVERLESFSPTRIWAVLRGARDAELDRERAEQQAAEYAVAVARGEVQQLRTEEAAARTAATALGDVHGERQRALAAKEEWLHESGSPVAAELAEVAEQSGRLAGERTEVVEALQAADHALAELGAAHEVLRSAHSWSTWDTFGGGGLITDMAKYQRMDQAQARMRAADVALHTLRRELADLGQAGLPGLQVDGMLRTFDVWFDNIFSDWSVRQRIQDAGGQVTQALQQVSTVREGLLARLTGIDAGLERARARRTELVRGGTA